jgi:hypothetical protein
MDELKRARELFAMIRELTGAQGKPVFVENDGWADPLCGGQFGALFLIQCPACGFDYNHLTTPQPRKLCIRDDYGDGKGQRISFSGECGHQWSLHFGTHKGRTFACLTLDGFDNGLPGETEGAILP